MTWCNVTWHDGGNVWQRLVSLEVWTLHNAKIKAWPLKYLLDLFIGNDVNFENCKFQETQVLGPVHTMPDSYGFGSLYIGKPFCSHNTKPIRNASHHFFGVKSLQSEGETFRITFHIRFLLGSCERMNPCAQEPLLWWCANFWAPTYRPPQGHVMLSCQVAIVLTMGIAVGLWGGGAQSGV